MISILAGLAAAGRRVATAGWREGMAARHPWGLAVAERALRPGPGDQCHPLSKVLRCQGWGGVFPLQPCQPPTPCQQLQRTPAIKRWRRLMRLANGLDT